MGKRIGRRDFLKSSVLAAAAVSVPWPIEGLARQKPTLEPRGSPKKVVVVGAGLAGLSAAYELTQAGHDVTVLEAQMRPGGRVLTLREPFSDDLYVEVGATSIPDSHDLTLHYIQLFNLPQAPSLVLPTDLNSLYFLRGKRIKVKPGTEPDYPYGLTDEETKVGWSGMWQKYIRPAVEEIGDPSAPNWVVPKKYDELTYTQFLRVQGASPEAVELLKLGVNRWGDGPDTISALVALRDVVSEVKANNWYRIGGGNDLLPRAFAKRLKEAIRYGSPVVRIEHDTHGVRAVFLQAGAHQSVAGDYLICAIPFSVLRNIEISPPFSGKKQEAIEELPYFSAARVSVQSKRRFWLDEKLDGEAWTDLPIGSISHMTEDQLGPRGILQCYSGGPQARQLCAMQESGRIRFVLEQMERVFPGLGENFEGGVSKCWDEDPWARGASSWYKPGQMTELWSHIGRPEGRVHFAGDHTSAWIRWMQGALESGNRAAREVNDAL